MVREKFTSKKTRAFKNQLSRLPGNIQETGTARYKNYFAIDPSHPLLRRHDLKDVDDAFKNSFSVDMAYGYKAVAFYDNAKSTYVWYWCGSHAAYDMRFKEGR